jgi:hypothetical protein
MKAPAQVAALLLALGTTGPAIAQYSSDNRYDPNTTHSTEAIQDLQRLSPEQRVDTALALLTGRSDSGPKIATQILLAERAEYVVPKLVDAIDYNVQLQQPDTRRLAFIVLAAKQEWPNGRTYDLLADGLLDYRVEDVCKLAFVKAPAAQHSLAAAALANRLEHWYTDQGRVAAVALEILGGYQADAIAVSGMVERVFLTPSIQFAENREKAALALAQIGGLPMVVDKYRHMDTVQYKGALAGLAWLGQLSPSPYAKDSVRAQQARMILLDGLAVPSTGVVHTALKTLPAVYGESLYSRSGDVKTLNPEVKSGLISGSEKQTDPVLRNDLVLALRQLETSATD